MTGPRTRRLAVTSVALVALALALRDADWPQTTALCLRLGVTGWLIVIPQGVGLVLQATGLQVLLRSLKARSTIRSVARALLASEAARIALPAGAAAADGFLVWQLRVRVNVPLGAALSAAIARKWMLLATHAGHVALTFVAMVAAPPKSIRGPVDVRMLSGVLLTTALGLSCVAAALAFVLRSGKAGASLVGWGERVPWVRVRQWLAAQHALVQQTDASMSRLGSRELARARLVAGLLHQVMWLLEAFETWLVAKLLGVDLPIATALVIETGANLVRTAAFAVPAGLGAQDASYIALLAMFDTPDPATTGGAFVLLKRLKELVWVAAGTASLLLARAASARAPAPSTDSPPPP